MPVLWCPGITVPSLEIKRLLCFACYASLVRPHALGLETRLGTIKGKPNNNNNSNAIHTANYSFRERRRACTHNFAHMTTYNTTRNLSRP